MGEGNVAMERCQPLLSSVEAKEIITHLAFSGYFEDNDCSRTHVLKFNSNPLRRKCNEQGCREEGFQSGKSRCRTRTDTKETYDEDELCKSPASSTDSNLGNDHGESVSIDSNASSNIKEDNSRIASHRVEKESLTRPKVERQRTSYSPKGVRDVFTSDFCDDSVSSSSTDGSSFHVDIKRLIREAQALESEGQFDDALEVYNEALDLYESLGRECSGALHCSIGVLQWKRGCYADSLKELHAAIEYHQQHADEVDESKFKDIILSDNEIAEAFVWASKVYLSQGEYRCCQQSLRHAQQFVPDPELSDLPVTPSQVQIHINALHIRGQLNEARGQFNRALKRYEKALEYLREPHPTFTVREEKCNTDFASILLSIGSVAEKTGDYEKAVESFQQAFDIYCHAAAISNDSVSVDLGVTLSNLGWVHYCLGNLEKALQFYTRALEYFQVLGENHRNVASVWVQMGMVYMKLPTPQFEDTLHSFKRALHVQRQVLGDSHEDIAITLSSLAVTMEKMGHCDKALGFVGQALRIRHEVFGKKHLFIGDTLMQMGRLYLAIGDKISAIRCFEDAKFVYCDENHLPEDDPRVVSMREGLESSRVIIEIAQY